MLKAIIHAGASHPMTALRRERGDTVVSEEGWSVRVLGRTGLEYRSGDRVMRIDSELLAHPHGAAVYTRSMRWWLPPHDDVPVTDAERARIVEHIRRAFRFDGFEIEVY